MTYIDIYDPKAFLENEPITKNGKLNKSQKF